VSSSIAERQGAVPETATPAPDGKPPRPLRRALLIAGVSCVSAAVLSACVCLAIQARKNAERDRWIIANLQGYARAQVEYHAKGRDGVGVPRYATPFSVLLGPNGWSATREPRTMPPSIIGVDYRGPFEVEWQKRMAGYRTFEITKFSNGVNVDFVNEFALCCAPLRYGVTGRKTFIVGTGEVVWVKDLRGEGLSCFPADPAKEGWTRAE
jgi:hypothetical protein